MLPPDWGEGYENVTVGCTCENEDRAKARLPIFLSLPIHRRVIVCEPLLGAIDLRPFLDRRLIAEVSAGGESGEGARVCRYEWVLDIRDACAAARVRFRYHQTGALLQSGDRLYHIPRSRQHEQAKRAGIDLF